MTQILQDEDEISALADLLAEEGVRSFLEVGSKFGGSLRRIGEKLVVPSRIVSVDLPGGTKAWAHSSAALTDTVKDLSAKGHETHLIWGNSQDREIVDRVRGLGPFDAIFIDADHRWAGVSADWDNYSPMGRIIVFHDIAWRRAPEWVGTRIDVPEFWNSIKLRYRHREIKQCPTGKNNGIGVLWKISRP